MSERDLFANFERMRREMDQLFGDVFGRAGMARRRSGFLPAVDVAYALDPPRATVTAELAGIDPAGLDIEIEGRKLLLSGSRPPPESHRSKLLCEPGVKAGVSFAIMAPEEPMGAARELDPQSLGDHIDRLYRAARSLTGSREEAEDLVQETFMPRLLRSDDDLGYLLRVLRNTFISMRRASSRRPQATAPPEALDYVEDQAAVQPQLKVELDEVYAAISELPEDFRDAVVAIDVVGLSYRQAAQALRVREATITTRLHSGRQRIARSLAGEQGV